MNNSIIAPKFKIDPIPIQDAGKILISTSIRFTVEINTIKTTTINPMIFHFCLLLLVSGKIRITRYILTPQNIVINTMIEIPNGSSSMKFS